MSNTIIVTGCAKRIGLGVVNFYLKNTDYSIVAVVRRVSDDLNFLCHKYEGRVEIIIKDLEKESFDEDFFKVLNQKSKTIKSFVHCASNLLVDDFQSINYMSLESQKNIHHYVFESALLSYLDFSKKNNINYVPSFINFGDYKINNNQLMGLSYSISKRIAIDSLHSQAMMSAGYARVNMISPGYTLQTEGYDEDFEKIVSEFPFKHTSSVDDIVETVDFLIHQRSVTGQHIVVDAGAGLFNL